jgi:hypothetical protein
LRPDPQCNQFRHIGLSTPLLRAVQLSGAIDN